jgi:Icc-related predicted phosphoesterase
MRRVLIAGNADGSADSLDLLKTFAQKRRPDAVLYAGNILGRHADLPGERLKQLEDFFEAVGGLGAFAAVVPGATDAPLRDFLRLMKDAEVRFPTLHSAHASLVEEGDAAFCGLGGDLTERDDHTEGLLCHARATAEYFLRPLWRADQPRKILLLSVAPPGPLGGEGGNHVCGDLIDSYHPALCVAAGATDRRGVQRIAHTVVVNPGRLVDGSAAWLDWSRPAGEQVEFLRR